MEKTTTAAHKLKNKKSLFFFPCLVTDTPLANLLSIPPGHFHGLSTAAKDPGHGRNVDTTHLKQHPLLCLKPPNQMHQSMEVGARP